MKLLFAESFNNKGQLKIQQMAFVLVALMIFFALVALFYFSIRYSSLKGDVESLREEESIETLRKISSTAEFAWTAAGDCASCVDLDKLLLLKERGSYRGFWNKIALLQVVRVHPTFESGLECVRENYPECDKITIIDDKSNIRSQSAFVALCRYESNEGYNKCDLGKVVVAFENVDDDS